MPRAALLVLALVLNACRDQPASSPVVSSPAESPRATAPEPEPRSLRRCFADRPLWEDAPVNDLLDRAHTLLDQEDHETALACAEEAVHQAPRSVEAHEDRAFALAELGRHDEARDAMALALAMAPDDAYTLETAADLYVNRLPPSTERSAIGLEYARRATRRTRRADGERRARLALLEGQALNDLGRPGESLTRLDVALALRPNHIETLFERGVALFDLCRFANARRDLERVVAADPKHAHAHYHLGLTAERAGDDAVAEREITEAQRLDPKAFPPPPDVPPAEFAARVRVAVAALPEDMQRDLATVAVETAELPALDDLIAEKPPLAPTILGLFRGLPLGAETDAGSTAAARGSKGKGRGAQVPCEAPGRAIVLYRRNLVRTVTDGAALDRAITRTLLHEIGHLHGEDDATLRDRGLE